MKKAILFFSLWLSLWLSLSGAHAASPKPVLLMEVIFPPQYDYAPDFNVRELREWAEVWRNKPLMLVGSGDGKASQALIGPDASNNENPNENNDAGDNVGARLTSGALQLQKSAALRLAHRRAQWLRKELLAIGFRRVDLQIGTLSEADAGGEAQWGGAVKIYALH